MKRFVALLIVMAFALSVAGCTGNAPAAAPEPSSEQPEPAGTEAVGDALPADVPAEPSEEPAEEDDDTLDLGVYTITVPEEWKDRFSYITGENGIQFFSLDARSAEFDGLLCWIGTYPDMSVEQARRLDETYFLGEKDGASYIMTYPLNVDFSALDPSVAGEYEAMLGCLPEIVASFKMK